MIMRVKARMDAGEDVPDCLVKTLLLTREQEKLDWEDMCMLSVVFTLGGIHSVGPDLHCISSTKRPANPGNALYRLRECHPLVPGTHLVTSRCAGSGPCRTRQGGRPGLLAKRGRRTAPSIHKGHHQGGMSAKKTPGISSVSHTQRVFAFRSNAPTLRFGWRRRTTRPRTLYTMGCTSRRTRRSSSTATTSIITKRSIRIRACHISFPQYDRNPELRMADPCGNRFSFNPDRFLGDT
jgi:hypothetical protein